MKILLFILLLILQVSCHTNPSKNVNIKNDDLKEKEIEQERTISLEYREYNKTSSDTLNIKKYAKKILENKIYPGDNDETFTCIKQLFDENQEDLEFYFKVFRVIINKSDDALAKSMGQEILDFLKFNPDFFLEKFSELDYSESEIFIGFMAYEFSFSESDYKNEIETYFSDVNSRIKSSTEPKRKYLLFIEQMILKETDRMLNEL